MLKRKYWKNKTFSQVVKQPGDSKFWSGLMEVKEYFFPRGKFMVQNDKQVRFWEDWWVGRERLMNQFPILYRIVGQKNQPVANVLSSQPLNISYKRALVDEKARMWTDLVALVLNVNLVEADDKWEWNLGKNHMFTIK